MYSKIILNKFIEHKNSGRISKPDGIADIYNADETAHVEFSLRIEDDKIKYCQFRAQANPYIVAACSTMTELVAGSDINEITITADQVRAELEDNSNIDIEFCFECLRLAVQDYFESTGKVKKERKSKKAEEVASEPKLQDILNLLNTPIEEKKDEVVSENIEEVVDELNNEETIQNEEIAQEEKEESANKNLSGLGLSNDDFIFDDDDMLDFGVDFLAMNKNDKK